MARQPEVALVDLRPRQERGLIAVRFVAQEVLGDELLDEPLQTVAIEQLSLQPVDLSAHERERGSWIDRCDVDAAARYRTFEKGRVDFVRKIPTRADLREETAGEHCTRDS